MSLLDLLLLILGIDDFKNSIQTKLGAELDPNG